VRDRDDPGPAYQSNGRLDSDDLDFLHFLENAALHTTGRHGAAKRAASAHRLREGQDDLLSGTKLRSIIRRYSDHIVQPIVMAKETWKDGKPSRLDELETVNHASALWAKPRAEVTDEQYKAFYKHVGHDFDDPLAWIHARVEGRHEYTLLLYIPAHAPFDLWDRDARHGVKLYIRRVFIMDDAEQLLPAYLRFVRGIVDSSDLPLNISREILQESKDIETLRAGSTRKVLDLLANLAGNDKDLVMGRAVCEWIGWRHPALARS